MTSNGLPCESCNAACCGPAPFMKDELDRVKEVRYIPPEVEIMEIPGRDGTTGYLVLGGYPNERCYFLKGNRCSIYELRPKICRNFGIIKQLPCPKSKEKL